MFLSDANSFRGLKHGFDIKCLENDFQCRFLGVANRFLTEENSLL